MEKKKISRGNITTLKPLSFVLWYRWQTGMSSACPIQCHSCWSSCTRDSTCTNRSVEAWRAHGDSCGWRLPRSHGYRQRYARAVERVVVYFSSICSVNWPRVAAWERKVKSFEFCYLYRETITSLHRVAVPIQESSMNAYLRAIILTFQKCWKVAHKCM